MRPDRCCAAVVLVLLAVWALAAAAEEATPLFHFAVLSDRTGGHTEGVYPRVIEEIALLNPDFVVTVGDHIEGYGEDTERAVAEWDTVLAMIAGLGAPVYMTPGNHDIWSDASRELYVEKTGRSPYYSFDRAGVHFVILDNSTIESWDELAEDQREWLVSDLERSREARRTFVFAHKPFWASTLAMGAEDPLHPVFLEHGVDAVFCGHLHHYFSGEYDGIQYVTVGSSGGSMYRAETEPVERGEFFQFAWVTVTENDHEVAVVHLGNVYGDDVSTIENELEIRRIESECIKTSPVVISGDQDEWASSSLAITNISDRAIVDHCSWEVPDGWTVEPERFSLGIEPGATTEHLFRVSNTGALYPVPRVSFAYPLTNGRELRTDVGLRVSRVAAAPRVSSAPAVDGRVEETCWRRPSPISDLYPPYEDARMEDRTEFLFAHDGEHLYLAAVCHDAHPDEIVALAAERDGAVYRDDCVGYFLCPDAQENVVYQIYVSADGVIFDQRIAFGEDGGYDGDIAWDGAIEVATEVGEDRWCFEAKVPFAAVGADPDASRWGLNFRRKQARGGRAADWQLPIDYDPDTFGELRLE